MRNKGLLFASTLFGLLSNAQESWNAIAFFELDTDEEVYNIYIDSVGVTNEDTVFCFQTVYSNNLIKTDLKGNVVEITGNPYRYFTVLNGDTLMCNQNTVINTTNGDTIFSHPWNCYNIASSSLGIYVYIRHNKRSPIPGVVNIENNNDVILETWSMHGICCSDDKVYLISDYSGEKNLLTIVDEKQNTKKQFYVPVHEPKGIAQYRGSLFVYSQRDKTVYQLIPLDETKAFSIMESRIEKESVHYGLDGKVISPSVPGIHIIKHPDNTVRKSIITNL